MCVTLDKGAKDVINRLDNQARRVAGAAIVRYYPSSSVSTQHEGHRITIVPTSTAQHLAYEYSNVGGFDCHAWRVVLVDTIPAKVYVYALCTLVHLNY